jgi:D-beta-D-heptose 7-phosphate kinase/D-beta-D-heptose 1-phosphate adenosyltransferase
MTNNKIMPKEKLKAELNRLKHHGKIIVFTNGCFDILHAGHVRYLNEAKRCGDVLVVGLNSDRSVRSIKGDTRPVVTQDDRAYVLAALESVDYVTLFDEETPLRLIEYLEPHMLVKGGDWTEETVVGGEAVRQRGGSVKILPLMTGRSTTALIEKIVAAYTHGG